MSINEYQWKWILSKVHDPIIVQFVFYISAGLLLLHNGTKPNRCYQLKKCMHRDDRFTSTELVESYFGWHFCRLFQLFCGFDYYLGFRHDHREVLNRFAWSHRRENNISKRLQQIDFPLEPEVEIFLWKLQSMKMWSLPCTVEFTTISYSRRKNKKSVEIYDWIGG